MKTDANQRSPARAWIGRRRQGHRKLSALLATLAAGYAGGEDVVAWLWNEAAAFAASQGLSIADMPESTAVRAFALAAAFVLYLTREDIVT